MPTALCSQNALLDERVYRPIGGVRREFDAVYSAQMEPFKRHALAAAAPRLALITYRIDAHPDYFASVKRVLVHAEWLNFDAGSFRMIPPGNISSALCRAKVGLMLSQEEGACYAAVEYLLSGLPVVSTASAGGRDEFFDDEYVKLVEASPEAVASGVRELIARNPDPATIRRRTLERLQRHRDVFIGLLQQCCLEAGSPRDMRAEWSGYFFNKMLRWHSLGDIEAIASGADAGAA